MEIEAHCARVRVARAPPRAESASQIADVTTTTRERAHSETGSAIDTQSS